MLQIIGREILICMSIIMTRPLEWISATSQRAKNFRPTIRLLFSLDRSNPKPKQATEISSVSEPKVFTVRDQSCPGWASASPCPRLITTRQGLDTSLQPELQQHLQRVALAPPSFPLGKTLGHEGVHLLRRLPRAGGQDIQPSSTL